MQSVVFSKIKVEVIHSFTLLPKWVLGAGSTSGVCFVVFILVVLV